MLLRVIKLPSVVCWLCVLVSVGCGRLGFEELTSHVRSRTEHAQDPGETDEGDGFGERALDAGALGDAVDAAQADAGAASADAGQIPTTFSDGDGGAPSDASAASDCAAGTYTGTFSGTITVPSLVDTTVTGTISVTTTASANGDLVITSGSITGNDPDGSPVSAYVTGTVSCSTRQLVGGSLTNGIYSPSGVGQSFPFTGTASASYYPGAMPRVEGTYQTNGGIGSGAGTFSATLTP